MDHEKVNSDLAKLMETEGLDIQLSYDGLRIPVRLQNYYYYFGTNALFYVLGAAN